MFADSSLDAMCIVAYFRDQQTGELAQAVRKCRVAPMKQQSIPRLELIWKRANGSQGRRGFEREREMLGHKPRRSCSNRKQKTKDKSESVSEKDKEWEKFEAYCIRFQPKTKRKIVMKEELKQVIRMLLRRSQMDSFGPTYRRTLVAGKPMTASDPLNKLSPFIDDKNVMQLRGPLRNAEASYDMKNPTSLSAKHPIVRKLVEDDHENNNHEGTENVCSILQRNYWITVLRKNLKNVKLKCVKCRKQQVGEVQPFMEELSKYWRKKCSLLPILEYILDHSGEILGEINETVVLSLLMFDIKCCAC